LTGISELIDRLKEKEVRRVALQFPAGLKRQSIGIAAGLRDAGFEVIISGDPCYGACDLALDLLEWADLLVHFGHTPVMFHPGVMYEPWPVDFDISSVETALPYLREDRIGLLTTVQHTHLIPGITAFLRSKGIEAVVSEGNGRTPFPGQVLGCSYQAARIEGINEFLFIGTGVFHPVGVSLATGVRVIALDPFTGTAGEVNPDRFLRKRFALIEKARNAQNFGVIFSQKSGQCRRHLAEELAALSCDAFLVSMREVSPDEMLNLGFECYINTACPRLSYDDQIRFPVPVLAPAEFEILCGKRSWDDYRIDEI
jgi:2-(3-amino-3-carboxypropyl)histidine synthase